MVKNNTKIYYHKKQPKFSFLKNSENVRSKKSIKNY